MQTSLISYQTKVESPFIKIQIGDYTFGHCLRERERSNLRTILKVTYPNYVTSINIKKINGAVNTYTIKMQYAITEYDDPNLLEKVFSSISEDRLINLSYGDWMLPNYIYKEEEALLTDIKSSVDFNNSKIEYTLTAVSNTLNLTSVLHDYIGGFVKPSDEIKRLLKDESSGLLDIFYGMRNLSLDKLNDLIIGNDIEVQLKNLTNVSMLTIINYLVSCMRSSQDLNNDIKTARYYWAAYDDIDNEYGGPYFKVIEVDANVQYTLSYNCYEVDVGYPTANYVSNFQIDNNETWSILYNYSIKNNLTQHTYSIDKAGSIDMIEAPLILKSPTSGHVDEINKAWWSNMTQYPISAKLTIKGLLRPALLMSYLKINTYFYGHKHISSGLYIINKQEDSIDSYGYKTTLSLTRISGDETI